MWDVTLAAGSAIALRQKPMLRNPLLVRVLGLYIAISAGTIQLLDIVVDRLALPERIFVFTIVLAIIGIPVVITATLFYDVVRSDRRAPRLVTGARRERPAYAPPLAQAVVAPQPTSPNTGTLSARLEVALSHFRIAELQRASGDLEQAQANALLFEREAEVVIRELRRLMDGG